MKTAEEALQEAVAERVEALGSNPFALEQKFGLPEDAIRSILRGKKKAGTALNKAQVVCAALGLELYVGPPRQALPATVPQLVYAGKGRESATREGGGSAGAHGSPGPDRDRLAGAIEVILMWETLLGAVVPVEDKARLILTAYEALETNSAERRAEVLKVIAGGKT